MSKSKILGKRLAAPVVLGVLGLGLSTPAWAHDVVTEYSPSPSASVTAPLQRVSLQFDNPPIAGKRNVIQVIGPNGHYYELGCTTLNGREMSAAVTLGGSGEYTVKWEVASSDGHTNNGDYKFNYTLGNSGLVAPGALQPPVCDPAAEAAIAHLPAIPSNTRAVPGNETGSQGGQTPAASAQTSASTPSTVGLDTVVPGPNKSSGGELAWGWLWLLLPIGIIILLLIFAGRSRRRRAQLKSAEPFTPTDEQVNAKEPVKRGETDLKKLAKDATVAVATTAKNGAKKVEDLGQETAKAAETVGEYAAKTAKDLAKKTAGAAKNLAKDSKDLGKDAAKAGKDAAELGRDVGKKTAEAAKDLGEEAEKITKDAGHAARDVTKEGVEKTKDLLDRDKDKPAKD